MTQVISDEPAPVYTAVLKQPDVKPSPQMEAVVNQLKSAIVEAYKLDGMRVKVVVVPKS